MDPTTLKCRRAKATGAVGLMLLISACSADRTITGGYKLYDLDGSNQAILGPGGKVSIADVTAYSADGKLIYVETGGRYDASGKHSNGVCSYQIIDTAQGRILAAGDSTDRIVEILRQRGKSKVTRSCVS
jgi:hypothetical protein